MQPAVEGIVCLVCRRVKLATGQITTDWRIRRVGLTSRRYSGWPVKGTLPSLGVTEVVSDTFVLAEREATDKPTASAVGS